MDNTQKNTAQELSFDTQEQKLAKKKADAPQPGERELSDAELQDVDGGCMFCGDDTHKPW